MQFTPSRNLPERDRPDRLPQLLGGTLRPFPRRHQRFGLPRVPRRHVFLRWRVGLPGLPGQHVQSGKPPVMPKLPDQHVQRGLHRRCTAASASQATITTTPSFACDPCPAGYWSNTGGCQACPAGTASPNPADTDSSQCALWPDSGIYGCGEGVRAMETAPSTTFEWKKHALSVTGRSPETEPCILLLLHCNALESDITLLCLKLVARDTETQE